MADYHVSPDIVEAVKKDLQKDPVVKKINDIQEEIKEKEKEIATLKAELLIVNSNRPEVVIKLRESVYWCLEVDSKNPRYFLKSAAGVYNCVAFKHKIELTTDIKNKIATTLSIMHKHNLIGRIKHNGTFYYGLPIFFEENDLEQLKTEHAKNIEQLA